MSEEIFTPSDEQATATTEDVEAMPNEEVAESTADTDDSNEKAAEINPIEAMQKLLAEADDRNLRLLAEFDNYRKRTQKEKQQAFKDSEAEVIKKLLPIVDNFERAMATPCADEVYVKGVAMIQSSLMEVLSSYGLEAFGKVGEQFDPSIHNAVAHIDDDSLDKNIVAQVFQVGYRIGGKVLRYAMVQSAN